MSGSKRGWVKSTLGVATASKDEASSPEDGQGGRWLIDTPNFYWDGAELDKPDVPAVLDGFVFRGAPPKPFKIATATSKRGTRGAALLYEVDYYFQLFGSSSRPPSDTYNPFGRFSTGTSSFLPPPGADAASGKLIVDGLAGGDKKFKKVVGPVPDTEMTPGGYPRQVEVEGGQVLDLVQETAFGAVYSEDGAGAPAQAAYDPSRAKDATALGLKAPPSEAVKLTPLTTINETAMNAFIGHKRSISQGAVMGASAGDVADNAGFAKNEGAGWEWLHLIAHSMGGLETKGPQVPDNLVAGTSECNTQMIVVEEFIKDYISKWSGTAKLSIAVEMEDPARHIGKIIHYHFYLCNDKGKAVEVFIWTFDGLSRTNPMSMQNRALRTAGRELLKDGGKAATDADIGSQPHPSQRQAGYDDIANQITAAMATATPEQIIQELKKAEQGVFGGEIPDWVFMEIGEHARPEQWDQYAALVGQVFGDMDRDTMVTAAQDKVVGQIIADAELPNQVPAAFEKLRQLSAVSPQVAKPETLVEIIGESMPPALFNDWGNLVQQTIGADAAATMVNAHARTAVEHPAVNGDVPGVMAVLNQANAFLQGKLNDSIFWTLGSRTTKEAVSPLMDAVKAAFNTTSALMVKEGYELGR